LEFLKNGLPRNPVDRFLMLMAGHFFSHSHVHDAADGRLLLAGLNPTHFPSHSLNWASFHTAS